MHRGEQHLPETEADKQTGGAAGAQIGADLDVQGRADGPANADELHMAGFELAVGVVVGRLH